jgi:hypothetical protein
MATTGFLEQRDAVAGSLHSSLSTANRPRDTSRPVNTTMPITWTQVTLADFSLGQAMSRSTV